MRKPALAAVLAGKDVYLQKPFTMTVAEGILLRDAVARTKRILQVGSQQRSWAQFRQASRADSFRPHRRRFGASKSVCRSIPPRRTIRRSPCPQGFDYARWVGPAQFAYYTEQRVHPREGYSRPGWLRNESFCLGMITGWGSHHYDTMHWALNLESSGPSRVEGTADFPTNKIWNVHGAYDVQAHLSRRHARARFRQAQQRPEVLRRRRLDLGDARWPGDRQRSRSPARPCRRSMPAIRACSIRKA